MEFTKLSDVVVEQDYELFQVDFKNIGRIHPVLLDQHVQLLELAEH
jgi:hypothetical protein